MIDSPTAKWLASEYGFHNPLPTTRPFLVFKSMPGDQSLSLWKEDSRQRILPACQNLPICRPRHFLNLHPSFEGSIGQVVGAVGRPIG